MTEEVKLPEEKPINPLLGLWFRPRRAIHHIISTYPGQSVILIAAALGAAQAMMNALQRPQPGMSESAVLKIGVIAGIVVGIIMIYIGGALFRWVGSWFGGEADSLDVRTALAWGQIPYFIPFFIWLYFFYGTRYGWPAADFFHIAFLPASVVFSIWQTVILSRMFGEVHGFSSWRGFFTLLIGGLLAIGVVIGLLLVIFPGALAVLQGAQPSMIQWKAPAPIFSLSSLPSREKETVKTVKPEGQVTGRSRVNFSELRGTDEIYRLKLADGKIIPARILEETENEVYVESEGRILNLQKSDVVEVLKKEPPPA
jgi:hypothetical protein